MGMKSRAHWKSGYCVHWDCKNKDVKCNECCRINGTYTDYIKGESDDES